MRPKGPMFKGNLLRPTAQGAPPPRPSASPPGYLRPERDGPCLFLAGNIPAGGFAAAAGCPGSEFAHPELQRLHRLGAVAQVLPAEFGEDALQRAVAAARPEGVVGAEMGGAHRVVVGALDRAEGDMGP